MKRIAYIILALLTVSAVFTACANKDVESMTPSEGLEFLQYEDGWAVTSNLNCPDENVVIPATTPDGFPVERITVSAFSRLENIKSIAIPSSVKNIEWGSFAGCTGIEKIYVSKDNPYYHVENNCLIQTVTNTLVFAAARSKIPEGVTCIGKLAYAYNTELTKIKIPQGVTKIDASAFSNCTALESIQLPSTLTEIGNSAFTMCRALESIEIPDSVTTIGKSAFLWCDALQKIELSNSMTVIPESMLGNCKALKSCVIPDSVTRIDRRAFEGCEALTEITIPGNVTTIGEGAFSACVSMTELWIPKNVSMIDKDAFRNCQSLTKVIIEQGSTVEFANHAFDSCNAITAVYVPKSMPKLVGGWIFTLMELPSGKSLTFYYEGTQSEWEDGDFHLPIHGTVEYDFDYSNLPQ